MIKLNLRYVTTGVHRDSPWSQKPNREIGNSETVHFSPSNVKYCNYSGNNFSQSGTRFKKLKINSNFLTSNNYSLKHVLNSYKPWTSSHSKISAAKMINIMFNIVGINVFNGYIEYKNYKQYCSRILEHYRWVGGEQKLGKLIVTNLELYKNKKLNDVELYVLETFITLTKKTFGV